MFTRNNMFYKKIFIILILPFMLSACHKTNNGLYQLPNQSYSQMMSYIINYNGRTVVIDGGTGEDEEYLIKKIEDISENDVVDAWFITHYHKDHVGALTQYLTKNDTRIKIKKVYYNFPEEQWVRNNEPNRLSDIEMINEQLYKLSNVIVKEGDIIKVGEITVDVLRSFNPHITNNAGNNSSTVFKFSINNKEILFLGDLGIEGGNELLKNNRKDIENMDYVQMAHHGQAGVDENVYKVINPKYCLWPTTDWLWENKDGIYKTNETREWIKKLNVEKNYIAKDGMIIIDLDD